MAAAELASTQADQPDKCQRWFLRALSPARVAGGICTAMKSWPQRKACSGGLPIQRSCPAMLSVVACQRRLPHGWKLACVGCCPGPSPALMMGMLAAEEAVRAEPAWKWRMTMQSL